MNTVRIERLRCEYVENPMGIEEPQPRLSWELAGERRGLRQTAYRVRAASTAGRLAAGEADVWDSGRVESDRSTQVACAGRRLVSRERVWWSVEVWDDAGAAAASAPAWWEMGLLKAADWTSRWITYQMGANNVSVDPAPLLRKAFRLDRPIASARAYVCGLGYHELHLNGQRVGDAVLQPAFTKYDVRALYVVHDVTALLAVGENAAGLVLGTGWYNAHTPDVWSFAHAPWRDCVKARAQIEVVFQDGTRQTIDTDPSWRWSPGPIVMDGLRNGETCDAREEQTGWAAPGFDARGWKPVVIARPPGGALRAMLMPPCRVTQTLAPVARREVRPGVWVFDVGQNIAGWARLMVNGPRGATVTMRYAEKLTPEGDIDPSNINIFVKGGEFQTDTFILRGEEGLETFEPRFTYHGFRYVQVTGLPDAPTDRTLQARVVHTDLEPIGRFACSNDLLNWIHGAARASTLGNYHGMPTDCPHREKNGWTGDASISSDQVFYNHDIAAAYTKWLDDIADCQRGSGAFPGIAPTGGWGYHWGSGPAWDAIYFTLPWGLYLYRGDTRILARHYAGAQRYLEFLDAMAVGGIVEFGLGDWCPPQGGCGGYTCPAALTNTAYYFAFARQASRVAALLGKRADAAKYAKLAARIRRAFLKTFHTPATGSFTSDNQTAIAAALFHGLVEGKDRERAVAALLGRVAACRDHLECGILGAKYVMRALTDAGHADAAYRIATQEDYPSWGLWRKQGATTLWETWDGTASQNHHAFSDVDAWLYYGLAGIRPDPGQPGFQHVLVQPNVVPGLDWVEAETRTPYGPVRVAWRRAGEALTLDVTVPPNATATVTVPARDPAGVRESGRPAAESDGLRAGEGPGATFTLASGTYRFESVL